MKHIYLFFALLVSTTIFAQIPQGFSYQAVALNASGNAVASSPVKVRLSILDNSATGTAVYTETHNPTTNNMGLFTLTIGQGTPVTGTFSGINWGQNSKFLKVEIDIANGANYVTIGSSQLLAVPYAMVAGDVVGTSSGNGTQTLSTDNGSIGILTSSKAYVLAPYSNNAPSGSQYQWFEQTLSGTPLRIMGSNNVVGVLTSSKAYVHGPYSAGAGAQNQWFEQTLSGTPLKIMGSSGKIGVVTSSNAYVFAPYSGGSSAQNQWFETPISGNFIDIKGANGVIAIVTSTNAYVLAQYSGSTSQYQWFSQPLSGTVQNFTVIGGKVMVQTSTNVYVLAPYSSSPTGSQNQWHIQPLSGTLIGTTQNDGN